MPHSPNAIWPSICCAACWCMALPTGPGQERRLRCGLAPPVCGSGCMEVAGKLSEEHPGKRASRTPTCCHPLLIAPISACTPPFNSSALMDPPHPGEGACAAPAVALTPPLPLPCAHSQAHACPANTRASGRMGCLRNAQHGASPGPPLFLGQDGAWGEGGGHSCVLAAAAVHVGGEHQLVGSTPGGCGRVRACVKQKGVLHAGVLRCKATSHGWFQVLASLVPPPASHAPHAPGHSSAPPLPARPRPAVATATTALMVLPASSASSGPQR